MSAGDWPWPGFPWLPVSLAPYAPISPAPPLPPQCPATRKHISPNAYKATGLQCKYKPLHEGDHAAYASPTEGDVFWPQTGATP